MTNTNIHKKINSEIGQSPDTRKSLFIELQKSFENRTIVTFFTSFDYPVEITDDDCDMLQGVLQNIDCRNGLVLMISSPGGDGLAAERIVNICRAYSGTGDYWALVPGKAKSAATIISMGASKIFMCQSSELGPVDPQIIKKENNLLKMFSAHNLVSGYDRLFDKVAVTSGPIEPYLQQLTYYDDREINHYRSLIQLSKSMSIKILQTGMMKGLSDSEIEKKIEVFLIPGAGTISHGRPIYAEEAKLCGLSIEKIDIYSDVWKLIYELYSRTERYVSLQTCKAVESAEDHFCVTVD